jgi:hypothetical protein
MIGKGQKKRRGGLAAGVLRPGGSSTAAGGFEPSYSGRRLGDGSTVFDQRSGFRFNDSGEAIVCVGDDLIDRQKGLLFARSFHF